MHCRDVMRRSFVAVACAFTFLEDATINRDASTILVAFATPEALSMTL